LNAADDEAAIDEWTRASFDLMEELRPFLVGKGPEVQSSALAELTSVWLAGMFLTNRKTGDVDREATDQMREHALKVFIQTVRELVPLNEELITKPMLDRKWKGQ
jgi:hypothetical protein